METLHPEPSGTTYLFRNGKYYLYSIACPQCDYPFPLFWWTEDSFIFRCEHCHYEWENKGFKKVLF
jgi:Zn ribbon nucleic-acid-binding protein